MHLDEAALRITIRETLELFFRDRPELEHADVQIEEATAQQGACDIIVDGCRFSLVLQ